MPELIAVQPLKYPRPIAVGEKFTVDARAARVLKMAGKARDAASGDYATRSVAASQPEDGEGSTRQRRRYQRRDMLAQD